MQLTAHEVLTDVITSGLRFEHVGRWRTVIDQSLDKLVGGCPELVAHLLLTQSAIHHRRQLEAVDALLATLSRLELITGRHLPLPVPRID